jgi:hypothetical protein
MENPLGNLTWEDAFDQEATRASVNAALPLFAMREQR